MTTVNNQKFLKLKQELALIRQEQNQLLALLEKRISQKEIEEIKAALCSAMKQLSK